MKIYTFLGAGILTGLGVQGVVIPGMVERLVGRHHRYNGGVNKAAVLSSQAVEGVSATPVASLDLNTVVGNGAGLLGATTASGSTSSSTDSILSVDTASTTLPTGILTDPLTTVTGSISTSPAPTDSTTGSRRTVTVTQTEFALASTTTAIAAETNIASPVQTVSNSTGFGGVVAAVSNDNAPTAGSVVTVAGGQGGFGGVVGAVVVSTESSTASTTTLDTTSFTSTDSSTTTVARGVGAFGGVVGLDSSVSTATDSSSSSATTSDSTTTSIAPAAVTTFAGGVGAFGGVVGLDAPPTDLTSTATTFAGFGGVVGVVVVSTDAPAVRKRDTFTTQISLNLGNGASPTSDTSSIPSNSLIFPVGAVSSSTGAGDDVVIVTQTTTIDPVVTVFVDPSTQTSTSTTSSLNSTISAATTAVSNATSTDSGDVVTVTQTVTSTLSAPTSAPTILSIGDLFPGCANFTSNITSLANITIPNIILPSNLTLAQVFGVSGENIDCATLLNLLGVNATAPVKRRGMRDSRRMFRYRVK